MEIRFIKYFVFCLIFFLNLETIHSQTEVLEKNFKIDFEKANNFYLEKSYDSAIFYYKKIEEQIFSAPVYYNLGNSFFQKKDWANAILYYEKTLKIAPLYEDAKINLNLAQTFQADQFENQIFYQSFFEKITQLIGFPKWIQLLFLLTLLFWLLFIPFLFKKNITWLWTSVLIFAVLSLTIAFFTQKSKNMLVNSDFLIVMQNNAIIYTEPAKNADILHRLHEGAKLKILSENTQYYQIQTLSKTKGWIEKKLVQKI